MLKEIKQSYKNYAEKIDGWENMNKNQLVNLCIDNEGNEYKYTCYLSAVILKYWWNIGKYYNQSKSSGVEIEQCYEWFIHSIMRAIEKRPWRDPSNKLFGDPNAPDKVINRKLFSVRQNFYQASNTDKRKVNFNLDSIDEMNSTVGDSYYSNVSGMDELLDENNHSELYMKTKACKDLVQHLIDKGKVFDALIIDGICFGDTQKERITPNGITTSEFSERKLVQHFNDFNENFVNYFSLVYNVNSESLNGIIQKISNTKNTRIYSLIRKSMLKMKDDKEVLAYICL